MIPGWKYWSSFVLWIALLLLDWERSSEIGVQRRTSVWSPEKDWCLWLMCREPVRKPASEWSDSLGRFEIQKPILSFQLTKPITWLWRCLPYRLSKRQSHKQQPFSGLQSPRWSFSIKVCHPWVKTIFLLTLTLPILNKPHVTKNEVLLVVVDSGSCIWRKPTCWRADRIR